MSLFRGLGFRKDATRGTTPIEVRKSLAGLFSATGVMPGGPSPLLTGNADWTYTVHGPAWFVATRGPSDGVALYGNDGDTIIGTTGVGSTVPIAPGAGLSRIDIAWTRHQSAGENGDPATTVALASEPLFGVASGTAASSSPVAPVIPAGAIELGRNTMTSAATTTASVGNTITQPTQLAALQVKTINNATLTGTTTAATIAASVAVTAPNIPAIATGVTAFAFGGGNTLSIAITFPVGRFTAVPVLTTGLGLSGTGSNVLTAHFVSLTAAGCAMIVATVDASPYTGTINVNWTAIQE
jgi:hypothetical protein